MYNFPLIPHVVFLASDVGDAIHAFETYRAIPLLLFDLNYHKKEISKFAALFPVILAKHSPTTYECLPDDNYPHLIRLIRAMKLRHPLHPSHDDNQPRVLYNFSSSPSFPTQLLPTHLNDWQYLLQLVNVAMNSLIHRLPD